MYESYRIRWPGQEHFERVWGKKSLLREGAGRVVGPNDAAKAVADWLRGLREEAHFRVLREDSELRRDNIIKMSQDLGIGGCS